MYNFKLDDSLPLFLQASHTYDMLAKEAPPKREDLKHIVESEVLMSKMQRTKVEEQLEAHEASDAGVSIGIKVATVAVGGIVISALTAGMGLIPYIAVVSATAVASGTTAAMSLSRHRPSDSRLIMACDTMNEALSWKEAIEHEIHELEKAQKPMLPPTVDASLLQNIISKTSTTSMVRRVLEVEGICVTEHVENRNSKDKKTKRQYNTDVQEYADFYLPRPLDAQDSLFMMAVITFWYSTCSFVLKLLSFQWVYFWKKKTSVASYDEQFTVTRKAQLSVNFSSPIETFLKSMIFPFVNFHCHSECCCCYCCCCCCCSSSSSSSFSSLSSSSLFSSSSCRCCCRCLCYLLLRHFLRFLLTSPMVH